MAATLYSRLLLKLAAVHYLPRDVSNPFNVQSLLDCGQICAREDSCVSIVYIAETQKCYLHQRFANEVDSSNYPHDNTVIMYNTNRDDGRSSHFDIVYYGMRTTWDKALEACQSKGGTLAMPKTKEKQDVIKKLQKEDDAWIGVRDLYENSTFFWVDGSSLSFTDWESGEPTHVFEEVEENCGTLKQSVKKWNDLSCDAKHPFFCQY